MKILIIIALIVCVFALISTLMLTKVEDTGYSSEKSMKNLTGIYLIIMPFLIILVALVYVFLN